ncbi:hypothetical protein ACIQ7Q_24270 [Streptomyces sp. NPDC096176]
MGRMLSGRPELKIKKGPVVVGAVGRQAVGTVTAQGEEADERRR